MATGTKSAARRLPPRSEPAWDIARLFPDQGYWDEWDYLSLDTNHLVEFTDGFIRVLPMPKPLHQRIVKLLVRAIEDAIAPGKLGEVLFAPVPVRLRKGEFREPDVVFVLSEHAEWIGEDYCDGADLVVEVVSPDAESHERDWVEKRRDYGAAGIREYWEVDPQEEKVLVLALHGKRYVIHGEYVFGERATSALIPGLAIDVTALLAASKQ